MVGSVTLAISEVDAQRPVAADGWLRAETNLAPNFPPQAWQAINKHSPIITDRQAQLTSDPVCLTVSPLQSQSSIRNN